MGAKALCIWFKKIDGFIKINDGIRYLVLSGSKQFNAIHKSYKRKRWYCRYYYP